MKKVIAILVISSITAGCAHVPGTNTPVSREQQAQQAMTEGCAGGALLGAALGAGLGYLAGGGQGAAIGAGAGALAGGAGGCAYANSVTNQNAQLASKENDLNAQIQYATDLADNAKVHNQQLAKEIKEVTLKVAQIKKGIKRKKATQEQLAAQKHVIDEMLLNEQKHENQLSSTIDGLQASRAKQPQSSQFDNKIIELQAQLQTLKKSNQALAKVSQRI